MYLRFFNANDTIAFSNDRPQADHVAGPFRPESLQGTYLEIRAGELGDPVAIFDTERSQWRIYEASPHPHGWQNVLDRCGQAGYSDWEVAWD